MEKCSNCGNMLDENAKYCANCGSARNKESILEKLNPTYFNLQRLVNFAESNLFTLIFIIFILFVIVTFKPSFGWFLLFVLCSVFYVVSLLSNQGVLGVERKLRGYIFSDEYLNKRELQIKEYKKQLRKEAESFEKRRRDLQEEEEELRKQDAQNQNNNRQISEVQETPTNSQPNINIEQKRSGCATVLITLIVVIGIITLIMYLSVGSFISGLL